MIGKLTGICSGIMQDGTVLIDVQGVGYVVRVPETAASRLPAGGPVQLFIHTAVREDAIDLYGFPTESELAFFKLLTSVSGVGPKTAVGILNVADVPNLRRAVARGDAGMLAKVYGIGKKSAERIVVELRDKLAREEGTGSGVGVPRTVDAEVMEALEALGYSSAEAREAIRAIAGNPAESVRERLAEALRMLGTSAK
jgi:holliday junction DNA helicase RuvA